MDLEKLAPVAAAECIRQQADSIDDLINLLSAHRQISNFGDWAKDNPIRALLMVGETVSPKTNSRHQFRGVPVTFANGGQSSNPVDIEPHLIRLFQNADLVPGQGYEITRLFLLIHPFQDGNGRTAWLLYNWIEGSLENPVPLPDFKFGE